MNSLDYILLIAVAIFVWLGFWSGFIRSLGRFLGLFIGAALASRYYIMLVPDWTWVFFDNETLTEIAVFIVIFTLVSRVIGLVFWLADKIFNIVRFFPFLTTINRLLGGIIGLVEGIIYIGLVLFLLTKYQISPELANRIDNSAIADTILAMNFIVQPFLSEAFRNLPIVDLFKKI